MRHSTCCCCLLAVVAACWLSLPAFQYILLLVPVTARCTVPMWCPTPLPLQLVDAVAVAVSWLLPSLQLVDAVAVAVSWLLPSFFLLLVCYSLTWFHFHCCLVLFLSSFPFDFCGSCHRSQCWLPTAHTAAAAFAACCHRQSLHSPPINCRLFSCWMFAIIWWRRL